MKNAAELKQDWNDLKARLKSQFAVLTESDRLLEENHTESRYMRLQSKLGKTKDEIQQVITSL